MLTLTSTRLTAFDDGTLDGFSRNMMLGSLGITVVAVVLTMAVYMIVKGTRQLKQHRNEV
jgi:preprotein translocase subunit SecD